MDTRFEVKESMNVIKNIFAPVMGNQAGAAALMVTIDTLVESTVRWLLNTAKGSHWVGIGAAHIYSLPFRGIISYNANKPSEYKDIDTGILMAPAVYIGQYVHNTMTQGAHLPATKGMLWNAVSVAVAQMVSQPSYKFIADISESDQGNGMVAILERVFARQKQATFVSSDDKKAKAGQRQGGM